LKKKKASAKGPTTEKDSIHTGMRKKLKIGKQRTSWVHSFKGNVPTWPKATSHSPQGKKVISQPQRKISPQGKGGANARHRRALCIHTSATSTSTQEGVGKPLSWWVGIDPPRWKKRLERNTQSKPPELTAMGVSFAKTSGVDSITKCSRRDKVPDIRLRSDVLTAH